MHFPFLLFSLLLCHLPATQLTNTISDSSPKSRWTESCGQGKRPPRQPCISSNKSKGADSCTPKPSFYSLLFLLGSVMEQSCFYSAIRKTRFWAVHREKITWVVIVGSEFFLSAFEEFFNRLDKVLKIMTYISGSVAFGTMILY